MEAIERLSVKLQGWINPNTNFKPRYFGYQPDKNTGELVRAEYKYPKYDIRLKFSSADLASQWVEVFRDELSNLSGSGDYICVMVDNKPYHLTFVSNEDRITGEIKSVVVFTFVEPLAVISELPETVIIDEVQLAE